MGGSDIYQTRRSVDGPFSAPEPVVELNSASDDGAAWVSPDGRYVAFDSNRSGDHEINEARR